MKRFGVATMIAAALVVSLGGAPRAQYDYYLTGDGTDVTGDTTFGLGLMGGGTDVDALFTWMSERAGGGDFVVIRASGEDGYNQYVFDLGNFDSVETLVLKNRAASSDPFVLDTLAAAYAALGRFEEASSTAQEALAQAEERGNAQLAAEIQARIELYALGRPYVEPRP